MSRVIAAIDNSAAAGPVLSTAAAVAELFGADLEALHVQEKGSEAAQAAAEAADVKLHLVTGSTVSRIVEAAKPQEVVAVVLGARGTPGGRRPAGHIATAVVTSVLKPVVVVPPDYVCPVRMRRILVPLEPVMATATALKQIVQAACTAGAELVVLYVFEEHALPLFTDQPQHEVEAWMKEFLRTYCDHPEARLELRAGVPGEHLLVSASEIPADALVMGWSQRLARGRAALVRTALEHSRIPVILVPVVRGAAEAGEEAGPTTPPSKRDRT